MCVLTGMKGQIEVGIEDSSDCQLSQTQELSEERRADIDTYAGFVQSILYLVNHLPYSNGIVWIGHLQ